jgi:serine/threonine protein kinase
MGHLAGSSLAHFRIEAALGEGGMGIVYRAMDEKLRRLVALKVLPESFAKDEERRRRFMREARSAAAVTHANIATVYEVGEADGQIFIAMELVDGESLRDRLEKGISVPEVVRIAREIARGLGRAHGKGIVHRDLKPENVMITRHDEVKILDFGLAKLREPTGASPGAAGADETTTNLTGEGRLLGTPAYMSPEQARGKEVDARTDVFSFGVLLYEMLAGDRPFVGQTTQDVITSVLRDTPARVSKLNSLVPAEVERVIERCLEKEPDARYAHGSEVLEALNAGVTEPRDSEAASTRRAASASTVSLVTPGPSPVGAKSKAMWQWGLMILGAVAAAGLGWGYIGRGSPGPSATRSPPLEQQPVPVSLPLPVPEAASPPPPSAGSEPSSEKAIPSATAAAAGTSKSPRPVVASPVSSSARAAPRPKSPDELFDGQK